MSNINIDIVRHNKSSGARMLAKELGATIILNRERRDREGNILINYGKSALKMDLDQFKWVYNYPESVALASNKLKTFEEIESFNNDFAGKEDIIPIPEVVRDVSRAQQLITEGKILYARKCKGTKGRDIRICTSAQDVIETSESNDWDFWTVGINVHREYRIHVFYPDVILIQQKRKKKEKEDPNRGRIRNIDNNWIFCVNKVDPPADETLKTVVKILGIIGLDFGAVDIVEDGYRNCYFLEVNTAPGIKGESTLKAYSQAFRDNIAKKK